MMAQNRRWRGLHWPSLFLMTGLCAFGVMVIYSATHTSESADLRNAAVQQAAWVGLGLVCFFLLSFSDYHRWVAQGWLWFAVGLLLLLLVLVFGREVNGAKSWIRLGPVGFQPAEVMKLAFLAGACALLVSLRERMEQFRTVLALVGLALIPVILILRQPDLGSAAVFMPMCFGLLFAGGTRLRYLLIPAGAGLAAVLAIYIYVGQMGKELPFLKTYQNNRIRTFFDPNLDPLGAGWTIRQSIIAIGSGGVSGKGYLRGDQNLYGFLPKNIAYNDFIFSVLGEEWGFFGGSALILGQAGLLLCIAWIGWHAPDFPGRLLAGGILGMLFTHFFINVGMTIKVVPITGIPLPFVSYGGTFLAVCMAAMGLMQSIWRQRQLG
ncbi:rod shape-determining protein RodA [bacterium]|nr:rod shape-determining protein RodA [bacterium]